MTLLEEMKGEVEGAYGELATVDAMRQMKTMKILKEIKQLQHQLEVSLNLRLTVLLSHRCDTCILTNLTI